MECFSEARGKAVSRGHVLILDQLSEARNLLLC